MKSLCDAIHGLGLKAGIYSTPWTTSYAGYIGGSSQNEEGAWTPTGGKRKGTKGLPWAIGKYSFAESDAKQWAAWGIDYLKYDWNPNEPPKRKKCSMLCVAADATLFSACPTARPLRMRPSFQNLPIPGGLLATSATLGNPCTALDFRRINGPFRQTGHWNDPDMLVVGWVGWGDPHPTRLTPDEQYTHISLWCMFSAPLLLGCDLQKLDPFTFSLLSNDEVLALDQDALGKPAACVAMDGQLLVYEKELEGGAKAVGLFNTGPTAMTGTARWPDLKVRGKWMVRSLAAKGLGTI